MDRPDFKTIRTATVDGVTTVWLDRPEKKNAMNPTMHQEMYEVLERLEADEETRVLVVTGSGDAFCAGQDLKEYFSDVDADGALRRRYDRIAHDWRNRLLRMFPRPTIAMVNGYCFGGAFPIVAACDIAFAADDAVFGLSEVNWGAIPGGVVAKVITEQLSYRDALYYALTGETFDGIEAARMRLVNRAVPAAVLEPRVMTLARKLAGMDAAALQATKEAVKVAANLSMDDASWWLKAKAHELRLQREGGRSEGIDRFLAKEYRPGFESFTESGE